MTSTVAVPEKSKELESKPRRQPRYNVVLWDDDHHTFNYVIRMMRELFGHPLQMAQKIADKVDSNGSAICLTTTKEHAELKRDQIRAFGKDHLNQDCSGSMFCSIEPEN